MSDSLPQRMREVAKVLREADTRRQGGDLGLEYSWTASSVEFQADRFEAEDRAATEREAMIEELAQQMYNIAAGIDRLGIRWGAASADKAEKYLTVARNLVDAGWTKAGLK